MSDSYTPETLEEAIEHWGVKGMRWGVRKARAVSEATSSGPQPISIKAKPGKRVKTSGGKFHSPSEDAKLAAAIHQKAKASTIDSLSNVELQAFITRAGLEQRYSQLSAARKNPIMKFVSELIATNSKAAAKDILSDPKKTEKVKSALANAAKKTAAKAGSATG